MLHHIKRATQKRIIRYLISGGTAASVNLGLFAILIRIVSWHPVYCSVIATGVAFWVSFLMQKYFTFQESSKIHLRQTMHYFLTFVLGLSLTSFFFYIIHQFTGWKVISQALAAILTACITFFIYKHIVFTPKKLHNTDIYIEP
ncbi:MAG TPA: GtrA family protein [Patescibacteria group bacterium]|nr:GtrA family protein [Patescibacteria group bacterium]